MTRSKKKKTRRIRAMRAIPTEQKKLQYPVIKTGIVPKLPPSICVFFLLDCSIDQVCLFLGICWKMKLSSLFSISRTQSRYGVYHA